MTTLPAEVLCTLTIPRPRAACFATPADVKTSLLQHRLWPERVSQERWRLETVGSVVDLEVRVPPPQGGQP